MLISAENKINYLLVESETLSCHPNEQIFKSMIGRKRLSPSNRVIYHPPHCRCHQGSTQNGPLQGQSLSSAKRGLKLQVQTADAFIARLLQRGSMEMEGDGIVIGDKYWDFSD